jgi:hypothetical protein
VNKQLPVTPTRHLPSGLDCFRLCFEHLACALPTLPQSAPPIVALNDMNVVSVGHFGVSNRLTEASLQSTLQKVNM